MSMMQFLAKFFRNIAEHLDRRQEVESECERLNDLDRQEIENLQRAATRRALERRWGTQ